MLRISVVMDSEIRITTKTILTAVLVVFGTWLAIRLRVILLVLFASLILALGLTPLVDWLTKRRIPRGLAVSLVTIFLSLLFVGLGAVGISPLIDQTQRLVQRLPQFLEALAESPNAPEFLRGFNQALVEQLSNVSRNILRATWGAFSGALTIISILFLTFYLLLDLENFKRLLLSFLSRVNHAAAKDIIEEIETKLGVWLRTQALLMVIVGMMTFLGLWLLGVDYALPLALISGLLEMIPTLGPIIAAIPALIVGFANSSLTGLGVLALAILVQQLENNLIVPKLMQKAVGFNPLVTMIIILVGGELFGLLGVLISIPAALVASILAKRFLKI